MKARDIDPNSTHYVTDQMTLVLCRMQIQRRLKNREKKDKQKSSGGSSQNGGSASKKRTSDFEKPLDRRSALEKNKKGSKKMSVLEELRAKREEKKKFGQSHFVST